MIRNNILHGLSEQTYHSEDSAIFGDTPHLTASTAKTLILQSPLHAHMYHPKLGGQHKAPSSDMDMGTLCHLLLLGVGGELAVIECSDWRKPANRELRDAFRNEGKLAVSRAMFDEAMAASLVLGQKLADRGFPLKGRSEVSIKWTETASDGTVVPCRARFDHLDGAEILDLKITESANPDFLEKQIVRMGYDIQRAAYERGLAQVAPEYQGRSRFTLIFCEREPPYCITPMRMAGSLRQLGDMKWQRAVNRWAQCLNTNQWPEYTTDVVFAEAKPWDLDAEAVA